MTAAPDITGAIAVVTGGANGIGKATTEALVGRGAAVVVVADLDEEAGRQLERCFPGRVRFHETDAADGASLDELGAWVHAEHGHVDALVTCAASFVMKGIDASHDDWIRALRTNVVGVALTVRALLPALECAARAAIVHIASISALIAQPEFLTYSATKGALLTMTRCMALDLAPRGIRVNAVSPGTVWTESNKRFIGQTLGLSRAQADVHPAVGGKHVLNRTADPSEIADVILFLLSTQASFITGENVVVDGGYTIV